MSFWYKLNGRDLEEIAHPSTPTWEMRADGGCVSASFGIALPPRTQHRVVKKRAFLQIFDGPAPVFTGLLLDPDRSTWQLNAVGLAADLRDWLALDAEGLPTRDVGVAVTQAMARGWLGSNPRAVGGLVAGDEDGNPISVAGLLDDLAEQTGQRWGVDAWGYLYLTPDPPAPTLHLDPGIAAFTPTDETSPNRYAGRYFDGTGYKTAYAGEGAPEVPVDITDRGTLGLIEAQVILDGMLRRGGPTGWTGSATVNRRHLTRGGQPVNLTADITRRMARVHGAMDLSANTPWQDIVIGRALYDGATPDVVTIEPVNAAARVAEDVWADDAA